MRKSRILVIARLVAVFSLLLWTGRATTGLPPQLRTSNQVVRDQNLNSERVQHENSRALEPGKSIERQLAGGETHLYTVSLTTGQYFQLLVDQRGIDVGITLVTPNREKLGEMDSPNATQGPELLSFLAEQSGEYRVEVISSRKTVPAGQYEIRIVALRDANELDKKRLEAQKAYLEGRQFQRQGTAQSRQKAIEKYEESIQNLRLTGESIMEIHALSLNAAVHWQLGQLQKALGLYNQAVEIARQLKHRREEAAALGGLALVYSDMGNPQRAREYLDQVLGVWQELGDVFLTATTHNNVGLMSALLGEPKKALEHYNAALSAWHKMENRDQEAFAVHNIGGVYEVLGDTQKSLEYYTRSLALFRASGNRSGEADDLNSIGGAYRLMGEFDRALDFYNQALELWRSSGNRRREALALNNIGDVYVALNNRSKALEYFNQALMLWTNVGDRRFQAVTLERIGTHYAETSETHKALGFYEQALQLQRAATNRWGEASVLTSTGFARISLRDAAKALEHFMAALKIYLDVGDRRGEAKTRFGIARAETDLGHLTEARNEIERALSLTEKIRADAYSPQLRAAYLATVRDYFQFYIDLLMRLDKKRPNEGFAALALQTSERARARSLLDLLAESNIEIRKGADPALLERERALIQQLNAKAQRRVQLLGQRGRDDLLAALNREINNLEIEVEQVQAAIRKANPAYASLTQPRPVGLREIQQQLDSKTVLLEYALGDERSYLWTVTPNSLQSYEIPKRAVIQKAARQVYELLTTRRILQRGESAVQKQDRLAQADAQLIAASHELALMVLGPAASILDGKRLVVVADDALQYVPFASLPIVAIHDAQRLTKRYRPLITDHEIITLPSASALVVQRKNLAGRKPSPKELAVIADPVFSHEDIRVSAEIRRSAATASRREFERDAVAETRLLEHIAGAATSRLQIPRLVFTRQEANQILAVTPRKTNLRALDFKASHSTATAPELSQYRFVHFATHGYLDTERPALSAIVLSLVDENGNPKDGFLRAHEIYNLNLPSELVVLSACQTGLGKEIRGEGLDGLTRGFMYAGARRVVVSLWNVNDRATAELMQRFYQGMLKEKLSPAASLRKAQAEMWRHPQWKSPYYWAAFVLQGEWL